MGTHQAWRVWKGESHHCYWWLGGNNCKSHLNGQPLSFWITKNNSKNHHKPLKYSSTYTPEENHRWRSMSSCSGKWKIMDSFLSIGWGRARCQTFIFQGEQKSTWHISVSKSTFQSPAKGSMGFSKRLNFGTTKPGNKVLMIRAYDTLLTREVIFVGVG